MRFLDFARKLASLGMTGREDQFICTVPHVHLHTQQPGHAGIVVCTADPDFERQAQRIHDAIAVHVSLAGLLIRVTRPGPAETNP